MVPPVKDPDSEDLRGSTARLTVGQDSEIEEVMAITGLWLNSTAFVREAVNEKLQRVWAAIETRRHKAAVEPDERPRNVHDVARRAR